MPLPAELHDTVVAKILSLGPHSTNKPSLLVDIENGRRTETAELHGELVRLAKEHNVPVPVFTALATTLRLRPALPKL